MAQLSILSLQRQSKRRWSTVIASGARRTGHHTQGGAMRYLKAIIVATLLVVDKYGDTSHISS
jgi:hypothetical protein